MHSTLRDPGNINYGLTAFLVIMLLVAFFALHKWLRRRLAAADEKATTHAV